MNRRAFVTGLGAVLAAPVAAEAQSGARFIASAIFHHRQLSSSPFRHGLRELGYIEGQNLAIEARLAAGKIDRLPALAAELIRARVDVIAAVSPPAIEAAKRATTAIPIVMAFISVDPVRSGFVDSLSRPGGNITGVAMIADDIAGKRLALLKEMVPTATRIALLAQVNHSSSVSQPKRLEKPQRLWASSFRSWKRAIPATMMRPSAPLRKPLPAFSFSRTQHFSTIESASPQLPYDTGSRLSASGVKWQRPAASCPMVRISRTFTVASAYTWTKFSKAQSPPISPSSSQQSSSLSSISRPPARSASRSRRRCCCGRIRWLSRQASLT